MSALSERYADSQCGGNETRMFTRESLAAAYIIGSLATLKRICLLIEASAEAQKGLSKEQAQKLLQLVRLTERIDEGM